MNDKLDVLIDNGENFTFIYAGEAISQSCKALQHVEINQTYFSRRIELLLNTKHIDNFILACSTELKLSSTTKVMNYN